MAWLTAASRLPAKPASASPGRRPRFEAGDVVVLGEADTLEAAEIRLLQGTK